MSRSPRTQKRIVNPFKLVSRPRFGEIVQKWRKAETASPARVKLLSSEAIMRYGSAYARITGSGGKKRRVGVTYNSRSYAHEREHAENAGWFDRARIEVPRKSFLAVLEEYFFMSSIPPRAKRRKLPFTSIRGLAAHRMMTSSREIARASQSFSLMFPTDESYRLAKLRAIRNPELRPHFQALAEMESNSVLGPYSPAILGAASSHLIPIFSYLHSEAKKEHARAKK